MGPSAAWFYEGELRPHRNWKLDSCVHTPTYRGAENAGEENARAWRREPSVLKTIGRQRRRTKPWLSYSKLHTAITMVRVLGGGGIGGLLRIPRVFTFVQPMLICSPRSLARATKLRFADYRHLFQQHQKVGIDFFVFM